MKKQSLRRKHVPQRTCVACREKTDKQRLTRLVRTEDDGVVVDPTGKRNGRGAYVCDKPACIEKVVATTLLNQALRTKLDNENRTRLRALLQPDSVSNHVSQAA